MNQPKKRGGYRGGGRLFKEEHQELQQREEPRPAKKHKSVNLRFVTLSSSTRVAISLPLLVGYLKHVKLTHNEYAFLSLLKIFGYLRWMDLNNFGIWENQTNHEIVLAKLFEREMIESITEKRRGSEGVYCITKEGSKILSGFKPHCQKRINEVCEDMQHERRLREYKEQ